MIKLFLLIDSLNMGGAEKLLVNFADITKNDDAILLKVGVLNPYRNKSIYNQLIDLNIEVEMFESQKTRELFDIKRFFKILKYVRQEKFDLIHTHLLYSHILGGDNRYSHSHPIRSHASLRTICLFLCQKIST